jgi:L-lactate dehydrogenase complex protein LldG
MGADVATATSASSSREEVLRRIRKAIGESTAPSAVVEGEWQAIPRNYNRTASLDRDAILEMFEDRLRDYDAGVVRSKAGEIGAEIGRILTARGMRRLVVPAGLPEALGEPLPDSFEFVVDHGISPAELDGFEGVLTACTLAIAETGTIVLQNVAGQGRRAPTLVPDYHLCVVRAVDVVETVPEAMARLQATACLATTFVSGPSATADIEMTRIKGVHGPRFLDVVLVI